MVEIPKDRGMSELLREAYEFELIRRSIGRVETMDNSPLGSVGELVEPIRQPLEELLEDKEKLKEAVEKAAQVIEEEEGFPITTSSLDASCLGYYSLSIRGLVGNMFGSADGGKVTVGALLHDFNKGFTVAAESIQVAHRALYLNGHERLGVYPEEEERLSVLLREDETGFSIVDSMVEQVTLASEFPSDVLVRPYNNPEFVIAGAETAQKYYKKLYPKIERLVK